VTPRVRGGGGPPGSRGGCASPKPPRAGLVAPSSAPAGRGSACFREGPRPPAPAGSPPSARIA